ncbi:M48 family metalloprotease [Hyalangium rubrum]|uniref:M48 family metalloprotease n=1 Tax=Hyalangium rubrum TaxID=3103134 RepID=A0ABU5GZF2_9BACT|nr:M48 family metalloprotease [Hyalangium sp. s54d21]MDY7225913.1 M48 family metalloprotease [Hyalangium sp. s54d21]
MSRHLSWIAGLGLLLSACGGSKPARPALSQEGANRTFKLVQEMNEATRRCEQQRSQVTIQEEYTLGSAVAVNWVQQGGGLMLASEPGQRMHRTMNLIGQNLAAQSGRPTLEWTFGVLEEPNTVNAASAPGGYVFVTRALLRSVRSEAQLAGVLAHEISHVVLKHSLARYDDVKAEQCKVAASMKFSLAMTRQVQKEVMPPELGRMLDAMHGTGVLDLDKDPELLRRLTDPLVERLVQKGHAHEDEFAADAMALHLIASAGYDPQEYITFLGTLPEGGGFTHHPAHRERQERLLALLEAAKSPQDGFSELPASPRGLVKLSVPAEIAAATR